MIYDKALEELLICNCFNTKGLKEKDIKELLEEINKEEWVFWKVDKKCYSRKNTM